MPYSIDWHDALPVLIVTYQGALTLHEYKKLCAERATRLKSGPSDVIILADMRGFEGFPDADHLTARDHPRLPNTVRSTLIVLEPDLYRPLFRTVITELDQRLATYFFSDREQALSAVPHLTS